MLLADPLHEMQPEPHAPARGRPPASSARARPRTGHAAGRATGSGRASIPTPAAAARPCRPDPLGRRLVRGRVDVDRQHRHAVALRVVDEHLDRVEAHRLGVDEPDEELGRVEQLEERRLVGRPRERRGMALGEPERGERRDLAEQLLGVLLGHAGLAQRALDELRGGASPSRGSSATSPSPAGTRPTRPARTRRPRSRSA